MNREERLVFLAGLTPTLYALIMWLEKGVFLFPFPLNEILFFAVSCIYLWWNFSNNLFITLLIAGFSLSGLLRSEFFLQFFLTEEIWKTYQAKYLPILSVLQLIFLSMWFVYTLFLTYTPKKLLLTIAPLLFFITSFAMTSPLLLSLSLALLGFSLFKRKPETHTHLLWFLLALLSGIKSITLFLLG